MNYVQLGDELQLMTTNSLSRQLDGVPENILNEFEKKIEDDAEMFVVTFKHLDIDRVVSIIDICASRNFNIAFTFERSDSVCTQSRN
jgi:hypothetical protein